MLNLLRSATTHRIASGFVLGAAVMIYFSPAEEQAPSTTKPIAVVLAPVA